MEGCPLHLAAPLEAAAGPVLGGPPRLATLLVWLKGGGKRRSDSLCQFIQSGLASRSRRSRLAFQRRPSEEAAGEKQHDQKEKKEKHGRKKGATAIPEQDFVKAGITWDPQFTVLFLQKRTVNPKPSAKTQRTTEPAVSELQQCANNK